MYSILTKAVSLILIIATGYTIKKIGWVSIKDFPKFSKIVLGITLPCALLTSYNEFNISTNLLFIVAIGFVADIVQQITAYLMSRHKDKKEMGFSLLNIGSYNIGLFGIPYISGFVGAESIIYSSLYDTGNSIATAGIAYGWAMSAAKGKVTVCRFIKTMLRSPVFDTYLTLFIMSLFKIRLPEALITFTSTVGSANTFLAMLMLGIGLELHLEPGKFKKAFTHLGLRYGFAILFTILTAFFIPFPRDVKIVLCMLFFAPMASMIAGFTSDIDGDVETSAFMTSVSIIVGIILMPVILAIMS